MFKNLGYMFAVLRGKITAFRIILAVFSDILAVFRGMLAAFSVVFNICCVQCSGIC